MLSRTIIYSMMYSIIYLVCGYKVAGQITIQVQYGNSNAAVVGPVYRGAASLSATNARANILYTQDELSSAGLPFGAIIIAVQFEKTTSATFTNPVNYKMYMGNTTNTFLVAGTSWNSVLNTHRLVFHDSLFNVPPSAGWITWPIDSFLYTGGALEIADDQVVGGQGGSTGSFSFKTILHNTTSNYIIGKITSTGIPGDILDMDFETRRSRSNIKITFIAPCSGPPSGLMINSITSSTVDFSVNLVNGVSGYQYAVTTDSISPSSGTAHATNNFHVTGLSTTTTYYVHVRSNCGGVFSSWAKLKFQTTCPEPMPFILSDLKAGNASIGWYKMNSVTQYEYAVLSYPTPPLNGSGFTTDTVLHLSNMVIGGSYWLHIRGHCGSKGLSGWKSLEFHPGGVEVFPNPGRDRVTVKVTGNLVNGWVSVYDINGMFHRRIRLSGNMVDIDISELAKGVYLVKYENYVGYVTKLIKF